MALKVITVSLSNSGILVVDPDECTLDGEEDGSTSRLVWVLDDHGTDARFALPEDGKGKGFEWKGQVNTGIFGKAHLLGGGKVIVANDRHVDGSTCDEQHYTLLVLDPHNGRMYGTASGNDDVRGKDPVIINR